MCISTGTLSLHPTSRGAETLTDHRYDYVFRSKGLTTRSCRYLPEWLDRDQDGGRLSDHAPVEAVLELS